MSKLRTSHLSSNEALNLSRTLFTLVTTGSSLPNAFESIAKQSADPELSAIFSDCATNLKSGSPIEPELHKHEEYLGSFFCAMLIQGVTSNSLGVILLRMIDHYEKACDFSNKIRRTITFPALVLAATAGIACSFLWYAIPLGLHRINNATAPLPAITRISYSVFSYIFDHPLHELAIVLCAIFLLIISVYSIRSNSRLSLLPAYFPVIGNILRKFWLFRFFHAVCSLVSSDIEPAKAIEIALKSRNARFLRFQTSNPRLDKPLIPKMFYKRLEEKRLVPPLVFDSLIHKGKLKTQGESIHRIAYFYREEVECLVTGIAQIIEPVAVLVIGFVSIGILISLYIPLK